MKTSALQSDPGIIPTEVAARLEREGKLFGSTGKANGRVDSKSLNARGGRTVDREGLSNNYAVEPEMYINTLGDLTLENQAVTTKRIRRLKELAANGAGRLTMEGDTRYEGQGQI